MVVPGLTAPRPPGGPTARPVSSCWPPPASCNSTEPADGDGPDPSPGEALLCDGTCCSVGPQLLSTEGVRGHCPEQMTSLKMKVVEVGAPHGHRPSAQGLRYRQSLTLREGQGLSDARSPSL